MELLTLFLVVCMCGLVSSLEGDQFPNSNIFSVTSYGAIGDGATDDSQAFSAAWTATCAAPDNPILSIPEGKTFLLKPVKFEGPCKSSNINVQISGTVVAPSDISGWSSGKDIQTWILFINVSGLIVNGGGQVDGKGSVWWDQYKKLGNSNINFLRPTALAFIYCDNLEISGLTHTNSPRNHINVVGSTGLTISNLQITAPESSPNTDGIDIGQSTNVRIQNCQIGTGDDCIAISGGSSYVNISGVECGPGHGISIGSLGANGTTDMVEEVHVRNCSFSNTMFGARIKSWQGGSGYARHITFEDIRLLGAANPIFIDQFYCIPVPNCKNQTSAVQVSDVTYSGFHGTSITDVAIKLSCSETVGCTDIVLRDVDITSAYPDGVVSSSCLNAHGTATSSTPVVNCLLR